ncbi:uncharacterized protein LOC114717553 [Neltuma alba]|uniref:uncharacterized protein LOC114717553 n=1 Tax=Neltuma alba TaxID=207710 RepID=UPI0010A514A9|nr:uncharacterized protein LOC114717553 [Prosopis alba]XP_028758570.1 uncharacterized protein LOC114717553 [Prosopis alba]
MAQTDTLEGIKGGGGSIKVGTIGTISSLMTRELEQQNSPAPHKQVTSRTKPRALSSNNNTTPRKLHPRKSFDEASSSSGIHRSTKIPQKTKSNGRHSHRAPMLGFDSFVDRSPMREKNDKKIPNIVEVVDIKCGSSDKAWATPLTNRLKKLGFSKLSETIN